MALIKTKIICTLGPSTTDDNTLREIMRAGMNVARLNFSHGTHQTHGETMERVKRLREELDLPVAIMLDTKGPEIRIATFENKQVLLQKGQTFRLCAQSVTGNDQQVSITWPTLGLDVNPGDMILLDDGLISMTVTEIDGSDIVCRVENPGLISDHKSVNIPGAHIHIPFLSEQDVLDIRFGIQNHVDFIAASFTRSAEDILDIRKLLGSESGDDPKIIAKIENLQGVKNIDEILRVSDGNYGGTRRSGRGNSAGRCAGHPKETHSQRLLLRAACDYRHADAGQHDAQPAPHPRRSHRCRQRHLRRYLGNHAIRRDRGWFVPRGSG